MPPRKLPPEVLVLLRDRQEAQCLAVAWPRLPKSLRPRLNDDMRLEFEGTEDDLAALEASENFWEQWAIAAGVSEGMARRYGSSLLAAGICTPAGLHPAAAKFVRAQFEPAKPTRKKKAGNVVDFPGKGS